MIKSFDELLSKLEKKKNKRVAIAGAHADTAIEAAILAKSKNMADSVLVGNKKFIVNYLNENKPEFKDAFVIYDTGSDIKKAAKKSVELAKSKKADLILKGKVDTGTLLKAVLDKENGLRTGDIMSDVLAYETPKKLVLMGDGGFVPKPGIKEKISIISNCVKVAHSLDCPVPKVALLTHSEKVNPKIESTVEAAVITKMNQRKQIKDCVIDGPLAFDNAISKKAAEIKGIKSPVAGAADVLVVPNIESGNIFGKALTYYCNYKVAHVVMGAKVPILIASRADDAETKFLSMALGIVSA